MKFADVVADDYENSDADGPNESGIGRKSGFLTPILA